MIQRIAVMKKYLVSLTLFLVPLIVLSCLCSAYAKAADRTPLLQEGKKSLYQRVVTHPGAILVPQPSSSAKGEPIKTFSVYYCYGKKGGFLEVGPSSTASIGWVAENDVTHWPQAMTLLFSDRGQRSPILFFKDLRSLEDLCKADDMVARIKALYQTITDASRGKPLDSLMPVLASEPADDQGAVASQRFYLMPIQEMSDSFVALKFLKVASIDPGGKNSEKEGSGAAGQADSKMMEMRKTGIAFVIDTTISMRPYIEQTRSVIKSCFDSIEGTGLTDSVGFAVVAFRNSTEARPKVEYRTEIISDFRTLKDRMFIEAAIAKTEEAKASTHSYNEDSMAGIKMAVDGLDWSPYESRIIILITDAGPLRYEDPYALTRMGPKEIRDYALTSHKINTIAVHVKTPSGAKDHQYAELAYRDLAVSSTGASLYMAVEAKTPSEGAKNFFRKTRELTTQLVSIIQETALPTPKEEKKEENPDDEASRIAQALGYALRLDYLGKKNDNAAPSVVSAWIADHDLAKLVDENYTKTVTVAVLLTKNQLSDLQNTLKIIVDNAIRTKKTDQKDFFQSIISAAAMASNDPNLLSATPGMNLQQTGVLGEFLEGLPYQSQIMNLDEDEWYRKSVGEQTTFIKTLEAKIERYEEYDKDEANWEGFGSTFAGDKLYRIPLDMLP